MAAIGSGRMAVFALRRRKILRLQQKKPDLMAAALDDAAPLMDGLTDAGLCELLTE